MCADAEMHLKYTENNHDASHAMSQRSTLVMLKLNQVHREVIDNVTSGVCALGFVCRGVIESPLKGDKSGNTEFLGHFVRWAQCSERGAAVDGCMWVVVLRTAERHAF